MNYEQDFSVSSLKNVNLLEKFGPNQCKLCFTEFSCYNDLKTHNENVHKDDQDALGLTFFTLKDLVHTCNICPLGFLTENILNTHKSMKHRIVVKNATVKCSKFGKYGTTEDLSLGSLA